MANAVTKTETVTTRTVTLTLTEDEAFAVHALASRGEELDVDHPIAAASTSVYVALAHVLMEEGDYVRKQKLYNSIKVLPEVSW